MILTALQFWVYGVAFPKRSWCGVALLLTLLLGLLITKPMELLLVLSLGVIFACVCGLFWKGLGPDDCLDSLRTEVIAWGNRTFPYSTRYGLIAHLREEIEELAAAPHDEEELADCFILLFHLSQHTDLTTAIRAKLEKCKRRTWAPPDADGVVRHVKEC